MITITPTDDNVIVKIIEQDESKIGKIIIATKDVAKSTLAEVMIPNKFSYHRNGDLRPVSLEIGMRVRLPKGNVGTGVLEAPEGETWLAVPEDVIVYVIKD